MASETTWLILGLAAGAGLALGAVAVMQRRQTSGTGVEAVEFIRDDHDRIAGFEKVGVGAGAVAIDGR